MRACVRQTRGRGFTLVETALSLALISILLAGMGSLIVASARSLPDRSGPAAHTSSCAAAMEQLSADITAAGRIVQATATLLDMELPDRDADGKPETVRYEWDGKVGGTISRVYNGTSSPLVGNVKSFSLSYSSQTTTTTVADTVSQTAEALVATYTGGLLFTGRSMSDANALIGQNIRPSFSAATRSWTITRAQLYMKVDGAATGVSRVQLRPVGPNGLPTGSVLAQGVLSESSLSAGYGLNEFTFADAPPLLPGEEVAIVVGCSSNCPSVNVAYLTLALLRATPISISSDGSNWSSNGLAVIPHNVWATTKVSASASTNVKRMQDVQVKLKVGDAAELQSTIVASNKPELM